MSKLRVAILHYHLHGGGVTRVIERTLTALSGYPVEVCVITGESPETEFTDENERIAVVKGLSYGEQNPKISAEKLLPEIQARAKECLGGEPDIWHIHNHSLGKNVAYTQLAIMLAESGEKLLFHIHDFAEDNRPENYEYLSSHTDVASKKSLTDVLYPSASQIHYGLLNGRDFRFLKNAGFNKQQLHVFSNPVHLDLDEETVSPQKEIENLILYPTRVIPRKNIGEFIFLAVLAENDEQFAATLAPKNPAYKAFYEKWKAFVQKLSLPVTFEAGSKWNISYPRLLQQARGIATTSIAEGFGLVYLESWLLGKPLYGRIIPEIVQDFKEKGIQFPGMYEQLRVPVEWVGTEVLTTRLFKGLKKSRNTYKLPVSDIELENRVEQIIKEGFIDFGKLDEELQRQVIFKVHQQPELGKQIKPNMVFGKSVSEEILNTNQAIVEEEFSVSKYGARLFSVYEEIHHSEVKEPEYADSQKLLDQFLSPENFSLLRN